MKTNIESDNFDFTFLGFFPGNKQRRSLKWAYSCAREVTLDRGKTKQIPTWCWSSATVRMEILMLFLHPEGQSVVVVAAVAVDSRGRVRRVGGGRRSWFEEGTDFGLHELVLYDCERALDWFSRWLSLKPLGFKKDEWFVWGFGRSQITFEHTRRRGAKNIFPPAQIALGFLTFGGFIWFWFPITTPFWRTLLPDWNCFFLVNPWIKLLNDSSLSE